MKYLFATLFIFLSFFAFSSVASANLSFNGGEYTNLCGSGLTASGSNCGGSCNPTTGACSASNATVIRFVCDGRQTQCNQNEDAFNSIQYLGNPGANKTVALVVFKKTCRVNGAWTCGDNDMQDYMVWYSGTNNVQTAPTYQTYAPSPASTANPYSICQDQQPVLIQFQKPNAGRWVGGADFTNQTVTKGDQINVNCFSKNGTALLTNGYIDVTDPSGQTYRASNTPELRNYQANLTGSYSFICRSSSLTSCNSQDSFRVQDRAPVPTPIPTPIPTPTPAQTSTCNKLEVVGGNNSLVPATVTLRASGSDNKGNIQSYRYYFGDGQQTETNQSEIQHQYTTSGTFVARVDVKDTQGNWKTSLACETSVIVKSAPIESFRSGCSDIYIHADNNSRAPSKVTFEVTGYDNKGSIQNYRLDFGNGITKDSNGRDFEQVYNSVGTYNVKAYVQDSKGNWVGGVNNCNRTVVIGSTKPLTAQPSTGTPTALPVAGAISGVIGLSVQAFKKRLAPQVL